jgi:FlaA1/EpsC-like NDP-sugar epimerase
MKKTLKIVTLPGLFLTDILFSLAAVIVGIAMRFDGQFAPQYVEIIPLFWAMTAVGLVGFGMLFGCYFNVWENASVNELVRQVMAVLATHVAIYVLNGAFDLGMPVASSWRRSWCCCSRRSVCGCPPAWCCGLWPISAGTARTRMPSAC